MHKFLMFIPVLLATGCASLDNSLHGVPSSGPCYRLPFSDDEKNKEFAEQLNEAISQNDVAAAKQLLTKNSFKCSTFDKLKDQIQFGVDRMEIQKSLDLAVQSSQSICRTEIVNLMIAAGAPPNADEGIHLVSLGCTDTARPIFDSGSVSGDYKIKAIREYSKNLPNVIRGGNHEVLKKLSEGQKFLVEYVSTRCTKNGSNDDGCLLIPKINQNTQEIVAMDQALSQNEKFMASPEYARRDACAGLESYKHEQAAIKHEQEIGNNSGAVDLEVLHNHGIRASEYKQQFQQASARYGQLTGKQFDPAKLCH